MRLKYIGPGNYFQVSGRELPVHEMYHLAFLLVLLVSSQARKRSRARRRRISFDFNCQSRCGKYNKEDTKGEYLHSGCTAMEGNPRKALILNANVFNHCIRYKIPSGPVNIVGSFKYLVHLYFQYMSAAKLHQSCRTCHIIFNVEYLKSVKNVGLWYHWLTLTQGTHLNEEKNCSEHKYFVLYLMVFIHLIFLITFILHEW